MVHEPQPTVAIGVGQAGMEIIDSLASLVNREGMDQYYHYIAIDTNEAELASTPPADATRMHLQLPEGFVEEDKRNYDYLTEEMDFNQMGANRQRPVGRYKLDSHGMPDLGDRVYTLKDEIERHFGELDAETDQSNTLNLFFFHSLGGGTGSGTFPLLSTIITQLADAVQSNRRVETFIAGVGVTPEVTLEEFTPRGDAVYYPNTYASLSDLSNLLSTKNEGTDLHLPLYSVDVGSEDQTAGPLSTSFDGQTGLTIDAPPFDKYFMVGIDEGRIRGSTAPGGLEQYTEQIDNTVAEGMYAISQLSSPDNFLQNEPMVGSVGMSEVGIPYDDAEDYCLKKQRRGELEDTIDDLEDRKASAESKKETFESVRSDPEKALSVIDGDEDLQEYISGLVDQTLGEGKSVVKNTTGADIRNALAQVEDRYGASGLLALPLTLENFKSRVSVASETIESQWSETVQELWVNYNLESSQYSIDREGEGTVESKATNLENFFSEKVAEYEQKLEEVQEQSGGGIIGSIAEKIGQTQEEKYQEWLAWYRDGMHELADVQSNHRTLQDLRETIRTERKTVRERLDDNIQEFQGRIDDFNDLIEEREQEQRTVERDIENLATTLQDQRLTERLGYLPITDVEALELSRLRGGDLDSLAGFLKNGLVEESALEAAIDEQLEDCIARNNQIMNFESIEGMDSDEAMVLFILSHDSFKSEYGEYLPSPSTIGANAPTGQGMPDSNDPYRIKFLSYYVREPVEEFEIYQWLQSAEEDGTFDRMLPETIDWRRSFAYLEWYDREIEKAFKVKTTVELPKPPELDPDRVSSPYDEPGRHKNYIKTNALSSYLWEGALADNYDGADIAFEGWKSRLERLNMGFSELQQISPSAEEKGLWLSGRRDWEEILEEYRRNMIDQEEVEVLWKTE